MRFPSSKLPDVKTSIFSVMSKLAHEEGAINLSQGFPNFGADNDLLALVNTAINEQNNQYAPMPGIYSLREAISEKIAAAYGRTYHPENEITITAGATQAIFTAIAAFVKQDDEVIVFKPAYDCYEPAIQLYGGRVVPIQLKGEGFKIDWDEFKKKLTAQTKMVIINTPHNPSGSILLESDMLQLQKLLKNTDIILLSDEVYEHIIFDGLHHESAAKYADLATRSLICASFGKTFHVTGWKVGYCLAPKNLMIEFQKIHQYNVFSVNHPIQIGIAKYLQDANTYLSLSNFYEKKRNLFLSAIGNSRFKFLPSKGTYFQLLDYSSITDLSDIEFSKQLIKTHKVASIPTSIFNLNNADNKQLRFCFAKTEDTLSRAADILNKI
ncbi:MAG: aminotransferase class I/II-fold pyridoxal phosphate-dependent enzyme [Croceitalea sp.]|nr:aminotransferase class I/II-fold pyridoxal phosphate-dependent enzyme [Croceitalea sp.]MBT8238729.1 aminotransferase class I/II-fold pyridoxal phosphate-dependent enzyme [Croceitalea sp.]NNC33964.1 aminotransferase class I/II-fold pyridoxal phosphate-dependent enzyme [Croceitalea sp.]NNL09588.1 aminotransferase class I/II-fold pyridoxal phosphate-dependent enzyme [Croceitalea sp.]NNM17932.1 aminotransferase class I/II-fold pyridoxal phosphate-dependent enzyme [Croceitalea sp.]